jgi:pyruvate carboxylase
MAIFLLTRDMTVRDLEELPVNHNLTLPNSVVDMFMGGLGQPEGGWPKKLQQIILRGQQPMEGRPGAQMPAVDMEGAAAKLASETGSSSRTDLMSSLMYPDVFSKFAAARASYGDLDVLPTSAFFYGLKEGEEIAVDLEPGKTLIIRFLTVGDARADGLRTVFFELNGQPRGVEIRDKSIKETAQARRKADPGKRGEVGAPIPGAVTTLHVKSEQMVKQGEPLLVMEAMKMQTSVYAPVSGTVKEMAVKLRDSVEAHDLLVVIE